MLGVSETVQPGDCALTVTGTSNVAKADHAVIAAIFKILISHLLCVLGLAALRPLEHARDRHRVDAHATIDRHDVLRSKDVNSPRTVQLMALYRSFFMVFVVVKHWKETAHFELRCRHDFGQRAADSPLKPWRAPADCLHF